MNVTDRVCSADCIPPGDNVHELEGPVKIILVDPPEDKWNRRKSGATSVALAAMMVGVNTFITLMFVLGFKLQKFINFHIILCTVGLQFCMPLAVLMLHPLFGAAMPLTKKLRKAEHSILQIFGLACTVGGGVIAISFGEKSIIDPPESYTSAHFFSGIAAMVLSGLAFMYGPCLYFFDQPTSVTKVHRSFGILAIIGAAFCFVLGILKPTMQVWLYIFGFKAPTYVMVFFTTFYTLVIVSIPSFKFCTEEDSCVR